MLGDVGFDGNCAENEIFKEKDLSKVVVCLLRKCFPNALFTTDSKQWRVVRIQQVKRRDSKQYGHTAAFG